MVEDNAIQEFVDAIKEPEQDTNRTYSAIVSRVDQEGTVWVHLVGAEKETPTASTSTEVQKGDAVTVEWRNNKLYIAGNYSNPAVGMARVVNVEMAARVANQAAQNAVADAGRAREAAESVEGIARHAEEVAEGVEAIAESAKTAADTAFTNLSQVQSVLEVAQWIATHGTYVKATLFNPNATYYTATANVVASPSDDDKDSQGVLIYYEFDNGIYVRTTDTSVDEQKTYYRVTGTPVAQPSAEHIADYYTLAVSEAMADYVQSHLALTDDGLYVMKDDSKWKVLIRDNGIDIIDGTGLADVVVATFDNDGTTFYDGQGTANANVTAEFSTSGVKIGSESSTSRVSVSPEGFVIEDDNLLTVTEIGKGETLVNHYENEVVIGDRFGRNNIIKSRADIQLTNPSGEIDISIPYIKYDKDKTVLDEGAYNLTFSADTTESKYADQEENIRVIYNASHKYISILVSETAATSYYGYAFRNAPYTLLQTLEQKITEAPDTTSMRQVAVYLTISTQGGHLRWNHTWSRGSLPAKGRSVGESFTLDGYSFRCYLSRDNNDVLSAYVKWTNASPSERVYLNSSSYMAVRYPALVLNGNPFLDYYGTAEAPYYSFGQRVGSTKGAYSLISGQGLEAQYPMEAVFGRHNDDNQDYALSVGNGTDENNRSNGFAVRWDGDVELALDTTAQSGVDKELYDALVSLGWDSDVII